MKIRIEFHYFSKARGGYSETFDVDQSQGPGAYFPSGDWFTVKPKGNKVQTFPGRDIKRIVWDVD